MTSANQNPLSFLHDQLAGAQKPVAHFDGKDVIKLGSNNYLGLTTHKALCRAAIDSICTHGVGAGAVRTIASTMDLHMALLVGTSRTPPLLRRQSNAGCDDLAARMI